MTTRQTSFSAVCSSVPPGVQSYLLQEKVSNPQALALTADKMFQSKVFCPVNLLADPVDDEAQVKF